MSTAEQEPAWVRQHEAQLAKKKQRIEKARGPFQALVIGYLGLDIGEWDRRGGASRLYRKVEAAVYALREWRDANNQQRSGRDEIILAIRLTAETLADDLAEAAAGRTDLDPATVAWALAGLRCTAQPFCAGCDTCFTITAPNRHAPQFPDPARTAVTG